MTKMTAKLYSELHSRTVKSLFLRCWTPIASFSNNSNLKNKRRSYSTIDPKDFFVASKKISNKFWDPQGTFRPLYLLNVIRVPYIRDSLVNVKPGEKYTSCLQGLKILDVGCGGGFLTEALADLGAEVTGIDPSKEAIEHAKHIPKKKERLAKNLPAYVCTTIEEHCKENAESYDVVVASEVIDHVAEQELFVESCARAAKPGGKIFVTTINRTLLAQAFIIYGYEYILKIIPKGVHEFQKFVRPSELKYWLEMNDCYVESTKGYVYYPLAKYWDWTNHNMYFFTIEAVKAN